MEPGGLFRGPAPRGRVRRRAAGRAGRAATRPGRCPAAGPADPGPPGTSAAMTPQKGWCGDVPEGNGDDVDIASDRAADRVPGNRDRHPVGSCAAH